MTLPSTIPSAPAYAALAIAVPLERAVEWFGDATNLPSWTGFFTGVEADSIGGRHQATSLAGPITTWTEITSGGDRAEVSICSLIHGRTERARLMLERQKVSSTHVAFIVVVLNPESVTAVQVQSSRMAAELAAARRMLDVTA